MRLILIGLAIGGLAVGLSQRRGCAQTPQEGFKPEGFSARAVVLLPRSIGDSVVRRDTTLAVEIRVRLADYVPRGMEPTLLIDTIPVPGGSGIVSVAGSVTTIGFLVERPELLRDGAVLELQMGDDRATRTTVPGVLRHRDISPLEAPEAQGLGLPTLDEWLQPARRPPGHD